jgi:hypothetical protein
MAVLARSSKRWGALSICQIARKNADRCGPPHSSTQCSSAAPSRIKRPARNRIQFYPTQQLHGSTQRINKCKQKFRKALRISQGLICKLRLFGPIGLHGRRGGSLEHIFRPGGCDEHETCVDCGSRVLLRCPHHHIGVPKCESFQYGVRGGSQLASGALSSRQRLKVSF